MKQRIVRLLAITLAAGIFNTGCMLSRVVDRAFLGITVRRPTYADRKTTGVFLLPFTFVLDVATFPIQALLVVILGDKFPFQEPTDALQTLTALRDDPRFQQLGEDAQLVAMRELEQLLIDGKIGPNTALGLAEDGHWTVVELTAEARQQLIARAQSPMGQTLVCAR